MLLLYVILTAMRFSYWNIKEFNNNDREEAKNLYRNGVNPLVSVILISRFKDNPSDIFAFLDTGSVQFSDPFLMADMGKAVTRIKKAIENNEKIAVYGDYDVDGMTSAATLALWLESKNAQYEIYIPKRINESGQAGEGFGLNNGALDTLKSRGVNLIITVDCGITANAEAAYAKSIGLDLIITDHHECRDMQPGDKLPEAIAVVNPKRFDCKYPYKYLAGVGVAFKLVCALEDDYCSAEVFNRFGKYLALGAIADVMPVTGENRKLICTGLEILNLNPGVGVKQLISEVCKENDTVTATTIGFVLAPRLNAAGRMSDPMISVRLLLTEDIHEAGELVEHLCRLNSDRRNLEQEIYEKALTLLPKPEPDEPIILYSDEWNQGVTGVVASRIAERYRLPAIIISINEAGIGRGSCRSSCDFDIYTALCSCKDILENYGGHKKAAGMDILPENIEELRKRFVKYYNEYIAENPGFGGLEVDYEVEKPELLLLDNIEALKQLEPYGNENQPPCLCVKNAKLIAIQSIGDGKHTRLKIEKSGHIFACIFFSVPIKELGVNIADTVDIAFEPQINDFRNQRTVQLQLSDIRPSGEI